MTSISFMPERKPELLCPFDIFPSFFEHFLIFGTNKMFQAHLVLSLPQPQNQLSLKEVLVAFSQECYLKSKVWTQSVLTAMEVSLLLDPLSTQSQEIYIVIHIPPPTFISLSIHPSFSLYNENYEFIQQPPIPTQHPRDILVVPMSMFLSCPTVRNLDPIILNIFTHLHKLRNIKSKFQNYYH